MLRKAFVGLGSHLLTSAVALAVVPQIATAAPSPTEGSAYGCLTRSSEQNGSLRIVNPKYGDSPCTSAEMRVALAGGINWRGEWSVDASYDIGDAVSYQGSSFLAVRANKGARPSPTGKWNRLAAKGDVGPRGEQGAKGEAGPSGEAGPRGDQGLPGEPGPKGDVGPRGKSGAKGDAGDTGPRGETGAKGEVGPSGEVGPRGEQGPQGEAGIRGEVGPQGPAGLQGTQGETGARGEQGSQGIQGPEGARGPQGVAGNSTIIGSMSAYGPLLYSTPTLSDDVVTFDRDVVCSITAHMALSGGAPTTSGSFLGNWGIAVSQDGYAPRSVSIPITATGQLVSGYSITTEVFRIRKSVAVKFGAHTSPSSDGTGSTGLIKITYVCS
jgi:hypothetical protein